MNLRFIGGDVIPRKIGEPGLIILISPGPKKASLDLKKLVIDLLRQLNLLTVDWE